MIFSFLSRSVNTTKRPDCPKCGRAKLEKQASRFASPGKAKEPGGAGDDFPVDEAKMERAVTALASEAENLKEDDPRQAARLMRKFSGMTGMELGKGMEEAIGRLEAGEDPEAIESEMGDLMEKEDPFILPGKKGGGRGARSGPAKVDRKLYDL